MVDGEELRRECTADLKQMNRRPPSRLEVRETIAADRDKPTYKLYRIEEIKNTALSNAVKD